MAASLTGVLSPMCDYIQTGFTVADIKITSQLPVIL